MSNLKLNLTTPTYKDWAEHVPTLGRSGKVGHNTFATRDMDTLGAPIAIVYHHTPIVTFHADETVTLRSGGWRTMTTLSRLHRIGGGRWSVHQKDFAWYVTFNRKWDERIDFEEGMTLAPWSFFDRVDTGNVCDLL